MILLAHHMGVEILGREFSPETPMEHVLVFAVSGVLLALMVYGAYAAIRDLRRWMHDDKKQPA